MSIWVDWGMSYETVFVISAAAMNILACLLMNLCTDFFGLLTWNEIAISLKINFAIYYIIDVYYTP